MTTSPKSQTLELSITTPRDARSESQRIRGRGQALLAWKEAAEAASRRCHVGDPTAPVFVGLYHHKRLVCAWSCYHPEQTGRVGQWTRPNQSDLNLIDQARCDRRNALPLRARVKDLISAAHNGDTVDAIMARNDLMELGDQLTRSVSAFRETAHRSAFEDLLMAWPENQYRPSLYGTEEARALADIYDFAQRARGQQVVAYRGADEGK